MIRINDLIAKPLRKNIFSRAHSFSGASSREKIVRNYVAWKQREFPIVTLSENFPSKILA